MDGRKATPVYTSLRFFGCLAGGVGDSSSSSEIVRSSIEVMDERDWRVVGEAEEGEEEEAEGEDDEDDEASDGLVGERLGDGMGQDQVCVKKPPPV